MNLTALIACKDRKANLDYCLASIHVSNPRPYCIVVDFKSEIPLSYPQYPWLKIIRVENDGGLFHKSRALNIGLREVKTRFVCATDADQIFNPNFFGLIYKCLIKQKNIVVMCKTHLIRHTYRIKISDILKKTGYSDFLKAAKNEHQKQIGEGCCMGIPVNWLLSVNGWDEEYIGWGYEDTDLLFRIELAGFHRCYIDHLTDMVHLPHSRLGKYYNNVYSVKNKKRLNQKKTLKLLKKKLIVVNNDAEWGQL